MVFNIRYGNTFLRQMGEDSYKLGLIRNVIFIYVRNKDVFLRSYLFFYGVPSKSR